MGADPVLSKKKRVVIFDANCLLCSRFINLLLRYADEQLLFSGFQSSFAKSILPSWQIEDPETVILFDKGKLYTKSKAIFRIIQHLRFPFPLLLIFKVFGNWINDHLYDVVAKNRLRWFGRSEQCYLPGPGTKHRFLT